MVPLPRACRPATGLEARAARRSLGLTLLFVHALCDPTLVYPVMIRTQSIRSQKDRVKVTFVLPGDHGLGPTSVVGDFNGWDPLSHPFKKRSNDTFSVAAELPRAARFTFRYLSDDGRWSNEPDAAQDGPNSVLLT